MDFEGMTAAEISELIQDAATALHMAQQAEAAAEAAERAQIGSALAAVDALLGPADAPPGAGSIRAVRAFDVADLAAGNLRGTTMAANAGLALSLAFEGLDILASIVRDIGAVASREAG